MARAVRVLLLVAAAFVAAHWSGFFFYSSLLISPCDWGVDDAPAAGDDKVRYRPAAHHNQLGLEGNGWSRVRNCM